MIPQEDQIQSTLLVQLPACKLPRERLHASHWTATPCALLDGDLEVSIVECTGQRIQYRLYWSSSVILDDEARLEEQILLLAL